MTTLDVKNFVINKKNSNPRITDKRVILVKGVSTTFESGKLNAIMGPNGCGKTTMLTALYGTTEKGTTTSGQILLDGQNRTNENWYNMVSIVYQQPYFATGFRVREALQFALDLKNSRCNTTSVLEDYNEAIKNLLLHNILDTKIDVISGGEKQRLAIANELIADKKILILDEPTSDLDSYLALKLIMYLKSLAKQMDKMIIFTIHQPVDEIMLQFDNILFMVHNKAVYSGAINELEPYLSNHDIVRPSGMGLCVFLFEAFYNDSIFEGIVKQKPQITEFVQGIFDNVDKVIATQTTTDKGKRYVSFKPKWGEIMILIKRSHQKIMTTKGFYIRLFIILFLEAMICLFQYSVNDSKNDMNCWPIEKFKIDIKFYGCIFLVSAIFDDVAKALPEIGLSWYSPMSLIIAIIESFILRGLIISIMASMVSITFSALEFIDLVPLPLLLGNSIGIMTFSILNVMAVSIIFLLFNVGTGVKSFLSGLTVFFLWGLKDVPKSVAMMEPPENTIYRVKLAYWPMSLIYGFINPLFGFKTWIEELLDSSTPEGEQEKLNSDSRMIIEAAKELTLYPDWLPSWIICISTAVTCIAFTIVVFTYMNSIRSSLVV